MGRRPSRKMLKHVTSRWRMLILMALHEGTHRLSDLRRKMGRVNEKMFTRSSQALERDDFLDRAAYSVVLPYVEYSFTPLDEQVSERVAALTGWIELSLSEVLTVRGERAAQLPDALCLSGLWFMVYRASKMCRHCIHQ